MEDGEAFRFVRKFVRESLEDGKAFISRDEASSLKIRAIETLMRKITCRRMKSYFRC